MNKLKVVITLARNKGRKFSIEIGFTGDMMLMFEQVLNFLIKLQTPID
jgi:hypothetical protein